MMGSAAQPFIDWRNTLNKWADKVKSWDTPIGKKQDTSWHDEMVKKANQSFTDAANKKLTVQGPKLGQRKTAKKKSAARQAARKRQ